MPRQVSSTAISWMIARGVADEVRRTVRCFEHDSRPIVTIVQADAEGLEYAITGCCNDLRKKARKAVDDLLGSAAA